ncbi:MAG TPA: hypothetical protein VF601_17070 [Beijerinckiaceae bacterium]|jgi:hypothetical protein
MKKMNSACPVRALGIVVAASIAGATGALGQTAPVATRAELKEAGRGAVFFDIRFEKPICIAPAAIVAYRKDGQWRRAGELPGSHRTVFGTVPARMITFPAGEYVVASIICKDSGSRRTFTGPYAAFQLQAGEVVRLGQVNFAYDKDGFFTTTGATRLTITPLQDDVVAAARRNVPDLMAGAVNRPLRLLGPSERRVKQKFPWE